jgi:acetyl-CoA C-acetyltransferase
MTRAAIVAPLRTPVGVFGGALRPLPAASLATTALKAVVQRSGIDPTRIDDVVIAQSYANSEAPCIGRWAALDGGLPIETPGFQIDRRCGSGLQAVLTAAMMVQTGAADAVIAGGVESMSNIEHYSTAVRWGARAGSVALYDRLDRGRQRSQPVWRFGEISGMVETAENLAQHYGITRSEADQFSVRSHQRAAAAWERGAFDDEVIAVDVPQRAGEATVIRDEGIRADSTVETLSKLRTVIPGGTVTAGNSSQQNDAAAACLVVADTKLDELGLEPIGYVVDWAAVGCEPKTMGLGPVGAVRKLFRRTRLGFDDMALVEVNEAFAAQVLAVLKEWDWYDDDRLNVNGSGISLGHPIGATGVRMLTTMMHELRRRGGGLGLETMCIGGGQGLAAVFEAA